MSRLVAHADGGALARAVAAVIAAEIERAIAERGMAVVAVPGGSTPRAIFPELFAVPLNWAKVVLTIGDERWAAITHSLSNFGQMRQFAIGSQAAAARRLPLVQAPVTLERDATDADAALRPLLPLDVLWAGVGDDGHTLSWFPGPDLDAAYESAAAVIALRPDPLPAGAPAERLTLTLAAARTARTIIVAATGDAKRAVLEAPGNLPVARLLALPQTVIHWAP